MVTQGVLLPDLTSIYTSLKFDGRILLHEIRKRKLHLGENVVNGVLWVINSKNYV